ncbi:MAG: HD domain-containing protein [Firmicutes bacterium]|nr:HD domain-containing protein [Bacillota bacterium]
MKKLYELVKAESLNWDAHENMPMFQCWNFHALPVIKNAVKFAKERGADAQVVEVAALFHEYGGYVDKCKHYKDHHIVGGERAEPILLAHGYSQDFVDKVKQCIFSHRASVICPKLTVEEICVSDADAVAHIENVFQMIMWMGQRGDSVEAANEFIKRKITKSYAKLSPQAKDYAKEKYEAILKILY